MIAVGWKTEWEVPVLSGMQADMSSAVRCYFAVYRVCEQDGWSDHALFMNGLVAEGFVVLGGPVGDGKRILLAVASENKGSVERRLAEDPWSKSALLNVLSIEPWELLMDGREL